MAAAGVAGRLTNEARHVVAALYMAGKPLSLEQIITYVTGQGYAAPNTIQMVLAAVRLQKRTKALDVQDLHNDDMWPIKQYSLTSEAWAAMALELGEGGEP